MTNIIVMLGPPGCGKTYLGNLLAAQRGFSFRDFEPILTEKFGIGQTFAANKSSALAYLSERLAQFAKTEKLLAVESTGISDRAIIRGLREKFPTLFVHLRCSKKTCVARVNKRSSAGKLNNASEYTANFYDFWYQKILPELPIDSTLDTEKSSDDEILVRIDQLLV